MKNIVICGANNYEDSFTGKKVSEVRDEMKDVLNIPDNAQALVCNKKVDLNHVMQEGETLEFIKEAGDKGISAQI